MKRNFYIVLSVYFVCVSPIAAWADSGVLRSYSRQEFEQQKSEDLRAQVKKYVEQVMIQAMTKTMLDVVTRMAERARIGLMPNFAYLGAQQGALQCFQQDSTMEVIRDSYDFIVEFVMDQLERGVDPAVVQEEAFAHAESELKLLEENKVFRVIVEKVIEYTWKNQQQVLTQYAVQQQMQQYVAQQQQQTQQAIQQQYQQSLSSGSALVR